MAQTLLEKEKEYFIILDAKIIEHEDELKDMENRLNKDFKEKASKFQDIIKNLKEELDHLYAENSLKQSQIDEQAETISALREQLQSRLQNAEKSNVDTNRRSYSNTPYNVNAKM